MTPLKPTMRRRLTFTVTGAVVVASAVVLAFAVASDPPNAGLAFLGVIGAFASVILIMAVVSAGVAERAEARLRRRVEEVERKVDASRANASRHEWQQEQSLERIERVARQAAATTAGLAWFRPREPRAVASDVPRVLFVTSNGGGMGHIARCAAVLRHSQGTLSGRILTLSTAAPLVAGSTAYDVNYFPSHTSVGISLELWRRRFARRLLDEISERPADVLVFDGTWVFSALTDVAEYSGIPLVWLRRGMWRDDADLTQVKAWREFVTAVAVPGDIAETQAEAPESFRDAAWTAPVSLAPRSMPSRDVALASLGLDPDRRYALVQLSGGNGDGSATAAAVEAVEATGEIVPVVMEASSRVFPLVDLANAWEFTITGAGYNSVHENLHTRTPGIYLPSATTLVDNQLRRAQKLKDEGLGVVADGATGLAQSVTEVMDGQRATELRARLQERRVPQGAADMARVITKALDTCR